MSDFKRSIINGTVWTVTGRLISLLIVLSTNIWLARLLSPREFGQIGIIMFFILIFNVFTESGLGGALVRKKEATENDYSTVFVTNLILSGFCYFLIYFSAGYIAQYYDDNSLKDLLVVTSIVLFFNALQVTQNAKLVSEMRFKQRSIYRFFAIFISSVIGIYCAYQGMGVWALVLIQILNAGLNTIFLWVFEKFFFKIYFSKSSFKELYSFGVNTTLASILNVGFNNIYQLVLGKYFSMAQTGYFYQAKKLQDVPGGIVNMVSQSVMFSALAKLQDDKITFTRSYNKITLYFLVLIGLMSGFIYIYAEPIVLLLYGKEWLGAVFYMQLLSIASFFYIQEQINRVIFKVFDKTRQILYLEYLKKSIQAITIGIGIYFLDLNTLIIGFVIANVIGYLLNYYFSRKITESFSYTELLNLLKICVISFLSILILTFVINYLKLEGNQTFLTLPLYFGIYVSFIYLLKILNVKREMVNIIKLYRNK